MRTDIDTSFASKLLARARRFEFEFLPPREHFLTKTNTTIADIQEFRSSVFREHESFPDPNTRTAYDQIDHAAWHMIARVEGRLVGCIRFVVFEKPTAPDVPARVLAASGCGFSPNDRDTALATLRDYLALHAFAAGPLVQAGGLAVAWNVRRSSLGAILLLTGYAFMRAVDSPGCVALAAVKSGSAKLCRKAGCFPLIYTENSSDSLVDAFHHSRAQLLGASPSKCPAGLKPIVDALHTLMGDMTDAINKCHA